MRLTVIRHLPTEWDKKCILQGKRDISITKVPSEYDQQIYENKQKLNHIAPFDCILASTLKRAIETASIYGFYHLEKEPLADELDFGAYEGLNKRVLINDYGKDWFENPLNINLGEKFAYFEERILHFLKKYENNTNLLLFGHGAWIRGIASIKECGSISKMNKINVANNELFQFSFTDDELNKLFSKRIILK